MKKRSFILGIMTLLMILLAGCGESYETEEIEATVVSCEAVFQPNEVYSVQATMSLIQGDTSEWLRNKGMAELLGRYNYNITVQIDNEVCIVVRTSAYYEGQKITVKKKMYENGTVKYE